MKQGVMVITMGGRPPSVPVEDVMQAIALHPEPVVTARDINGKIGLQPPGALARLRALEDDGYLKSKDAGSSAVVFWMTERGRAVLAEIDQEDTNVKR